MLPQALATLIVLFVCANPVSASAITCAKPANAVTTFHAAFKSGTMSFGSAKATGLSAKACGAVTGKHEMLVSTVQSRDIKFPAVSVKFLFISLPSTITVNAPLSGPFKPSRKYTSAAVNLAANLSVSAKLLGFSCAIGPLTPTLTTGKSGSLQGTTFTGSLKNGFTGKVVANDFAVPSIQNSKTCPWLIAKLANVLLSLPAVPGKAAISMEGSITTP
ncbi:MAG: hypothetical protein ACYC9L_08550 [Sulfuricaulis sp.]